MQEDNASLEEILASIKSMMARDDAERRASNAGERDIGEAMQSVNAVADPADAEEAADVHELADAPAPEPGSDVDAGRQRSAAPPVETLTRPATIAAIRQSLAALDWLGQGEEPQGLPSHPATIETLTRAMLRPMLAEWLDANLPALVERMVEAEIARVMRSES